VDEIAMPAVVEALSATEPPKFAGHPLRGCRARRTDKKQKWRKFMGKTSGRAA